MASRRTRAPLALQFRAKCKTVGECLEAGWPSSATRLWSVTESVTSIWKQRSQPRSSAMIVAKRPKARIARAPAAENFTACSIPPTTGSV